MVQQLVLRVVLLILLWIYICISVYRDLPNTSPQNILQFIRTHMLLNCYLCVIWPLWFHFMFTSPKNLAISLGMAFLVLFANTVGAYFLAQGTPGTPNYIGILLIQWTFLFLFCSILFLLHSTKICPLTAAFLTTIGASVLVTSLFWCEILLKATENYRQWVIATILHTNPMVATAICFPSYDYLRAPILYEKCPIGANYPFHYPHWHHVVIIFFISGIIVLLIKALYFLLVVKPKNTT